MPREIRTGYEMGAEIRCYYTMCGLVQHDKPDINSPLLKAAQPRMQGSRM